MFYSHFDKTSSHPMYWNNIIISPIFSVLTYLFWQCHLPFSYIKDSIPWWQSTKPNLDSPRTMKAFLLSWLSATSSSTVNKSVLVLYNLSRTMTFPTKTTGPLFNHLQHQVHVTAHQLVKGRRCSICLLSPSFLALRTSKLHGGTAICWSQFNFLQTATTKCRLGDLFVKNQH